MSIPVGGASGATFCDINTTPLIDVMLSFAYIKTQNLTLIHN